MTARIDIVAAFKAHLGWVNVVCVRAIASQPEPLRVDRVELFQDAPREVREPYHVAGGWHGLKKSPRPPEPAAIIRNGRRRQVTATRKALKGYALALKNAGCQLRAAVVLTGRSRPFEGLEDILGSHAHIHVAEGEAVREATRRALTAESVPWANIDEKSILEVAAAELDRTTAACDTLVKAARPEAARHWSKEERWLALGAWLGARGHLGSE